MLKIEADTLRRELNEWRERAGISRIEEPLRGDGFAMVISGELEVIIGAPTNGNDDGEEDDGENYGGYVGGDGHAEDEFGMDLGVDAGSPIEDPVVLAAMMKHPTQFAHAVPPPPGGAGLPLGLSRPQSMGGGATNVPASFEAMYDSYPTHISANHHNSQRAYHSRDDLATHQMLQHAYIQQQHRERERALYQRQQEQEKMWGLYATNPTAVPKYPHPHQIMMMQAAQRSLFTPPSTAHGRSCSPGSPASKMSDPQGRERSGSVSSRDSHSPSYELTSPPGEYFTHPHSDFGAGVVPRSGGMLGMDMMGIGMGIGVEGM